MSAAVPCLYCNSVVSKKRQHLMRKHSLTAAQTVQLLHLQKKGAGLIPCPVDSCPSWVNDIRSHLKNKHPGLHPPNLPKSSKDGAEQLCKRRQALHLLEKECALTRRGGSQKPKLTPYLRSETKTLKIRMVNDTTNSHALVYLRTPHVPSHIPKHHDVDADVDEDDIVSPNEDLYDDKVTTTWPMRFREWLQSLLGGVLHESTIEQHVSQAQRIVRDNFENNIALFRRCPQHSFIDRMLGSSSFLSKAFHKDRFGATRTDIRKGLSAPTLRNYLTSARKLLEFFDRKDVAQQLRTSSEQLKLRKHITARKHRRREDRTSQVEQLRCAVDRYYSSDTFTKRRQVLLSIRRGDNLDNHDPDFGTLQYHILLQVMMSGRRTMDPFNCLISEFSAGRWLKGEEDGTDMYVFSVLNHKTAATYGAARIAVSATCYAEMCGYLLLRKRLLDKLESNCSFLFPTCSGKHSGCLNQRLMSRVLGSPQIPVTGTLFRCMVGDDSFSETDKESRDRVQHMCHSQSTHDNYYRYRDLDKVAAQVTKRNLSLFSRENASADEYVPPDTAEWEEHDDTSNVAIKRATTHISTESSFVASTKPKSGGRKLIFTQQERVYLHENFQHLVGVQIRERDVKHILMQMQDPHGLLKKNTLKQVTDGVRSVLRAQRKRNSDAF